MPCHRYTLCPIVEQISRDPLKYEVDATRLGSEHNVAINFRNLIGACQGEHPNLIVLVLRAHHQDCSTQSGPPSTSAQHLSGTYAIIYTQRCNADFLTGDTQQLEVSFSFDSSALHWSLPTRLV